MYTLTYFNTFCYNFSNKQDSLIGDLIKENKELTDLLNVSEVQSMVNIYTLFCF